MVAKMWKDSRGSRTLPKSESWDGFWVLALTPAAPIPVLSQQQCYGAGGGLDPSILYRATPAYGAGGGLDPSIL